MRNLMVCLVLLMHVTATCQSVDSVFRFVDSALNIMQQRSMYAHKLDWAQLRDSIHQLASGAKTYSETFNALAYAFDRLSDKHGWLVIDDSTHVNKGLQGKTRPVSAAIKATLAKGPKLYNGIVAGKYAYVSIHFFGRQTLEEMNRFAQQIQDSLCKNINAQTRGIIIDLRLNGGGNAFPMFQGIANVLGNRVLSEGVDGKGRATGKFAIGNGQVKIATNYGDSLELSLHRSCGDLSNLPVAVLIGQVTGSAAEQLAIAFTSRPRSVLIGEQTAGYVTANNGFLLPGSGNGIVLAEGLTRNMQGKVFENAVDPDIKVTGGDNFTDRKKDKKIQAAVRWLDAQDVKKAPKSDLAKADHPKIRVMNW